MRIFKILTTLLLLVFTLGTFLVLVTIAIIKFNNQSFIANLLKEEITRTPQLVTLVNLNEPGDGRYIYLKNESNYVQANLYYLDTAKPDIEVESWIDEIISLTTNKKAKVISKKLNIDEKRHFDKEDLNTIRNNLIDPKVDAPLVNIIYISKFEESPTNVGITIHRDTIYIFKHALEELTESEFKLKRLEKSTLMHEWGHLLDFDHTESDDCVMSEKVEVYDSHWLKGRELPVEYCLETLRAHERDL